MVSDDCSLFQSAAPQLHTVLAASSRRCFRPEVVTCLPTYFASAKDTVETAPAVRADRHNFASVQGALQTAMGFAAGLWPSPEPPLKVLGFRVTPAAWQLHLPGCHGDSLLQLTKAHAHSSSMYVLVSPCLSFCLWFCPFCFFLSHSCVVSLPLSAFRSFFHRLCVFRSFRRSFFIATFFSVKICLCFSLSLSLSR